MCQYSFDSKPEGFWGLDCVEFIFWYNGVKKRQFNSTLIGANEINMQVNESNIVNQFKCEIKFS